MNTSTSTRIGITDEYILSPDQENIMKLLNDAIDQSIPLSLLDVKLHKPPGHLVLDVTILEREGFVCHDPQYYPLGEYVYFPLQLRMTEKGRTYAIKDR